MLSAEEALTYAKNVLHIKNIERKLIDNKLNLLNELIRCQHQYITYQTFQMIGTDVNKRMQPTQEECIRDNLQQIGGVCINQQGFFVKFLEALGYNVHFVFGDIPLAKIRNNHAVIIAHHVEEADDLFYVDVGFCSPTFCAIPLHNLEDGQFHTYQFSFLGLRLSKDGGNFIRSHKKKTEDGTEIWQEILVFHPDSPRDFKEFESSMNIVFTDELESLYLQNVFATLYPPGKAISLKNLTVKIWNEETNDIHQIDFDSTDAAVKKIVELFPALPKDLVQKGYVARETWEQRNVGKEKLGSFDILDVSNISLLSIS